MEYDAEAALYPGASYPVSADFIPEILLADSNDELLEDTELTDKRHWKRKLWQKKSSI